MTVFLIVVLIWFAFAAILVLLSIAVEVTQPDATPSKIFASAILLIVYLSLMTWDIFLLVS